VKASKLLILFLSLLFSWGLLQAQVMRLGVHASLGYAWPHQDVLDKGLNSSLGIDLNLSRGWCLIFDFSYGRYQVESRPRGLQKGTIVLTPFWARVQHRFLPDRNISPYLFMGSGYVFSRFLMEELLTIPEISVSQKVENGWGFTGGAGLELKLKRENISIFTEAIYISRKNGGITTINDLNFGLREEKFKVDLSSWQIRVGFRYFY